MGTEAPLDGKVALVTGANTGIGLVTARELARRGARVVIACRSARKGGEAADLIRGETGKTVDVLALDLGELGSVRACAASFASLGLPLHILVNNAGLAGKRGITASGFEIAFGTNHVGTFLLTTLLLDSIKASAPARIVTVASKAHYRSPGIDFEAVRRPTVTVTGLPEYGVSKLANVLFSAELGRRLAGTGVTTYSLHPGVVATDVWRQMPWPVRPIAKAFMISPEEGAATTLHCATAPGCANETGLYYDRCAVRTPSAVARDEALARELWDKSEEWTAAG